MRYRGPGGDTFTIDLETADSNALLEAQERIMVLRDVIQGKVDDAKALRQTEGKGADPRDFARWKRMLRQFASQLRKINRHLARAAQERKDERRARNDTLLQYFIECAREIMDGDLYREIMDAAEKRMETANG